MFFVFFAGSAPFVKDRPLEFLPYIILVSRATLITISEPPRCVASLIFVVSRPNPKIPTKIAPKFFLCFVSFDDVLLVLIREFVVLQVDLAFPHHLHLEIHPKSSDLSPFSCSSRAIPERS